MLAIINLNNIVHLANRNKLINYFAKIEDTIVAFK